MDDAGAFALCGGLCNRRTLWVGLWTDFSGRVVVGVVFRWVGSEGGVSPADGVVKHRVITVGRPSGWAKSATEEFAKRIRGFAEIELLHVKEGTKQEAELLEKTEGWHRVALDERGRTAGTAEWKKEFETWERGGKAKTAWILGGADGHGAGFRDQCGDLWSLGPQTLSHELALVVLLEQIYRVESWRAGHPYHRE